MKNSFYYIDEAGSIDGNSNFFILGCYKTDTPEILRLEIEKLKEEISNSPYFAFERGSFNKEGFHACDNHFDIRARFFNLISTLNIRAYILLLDKRSIFFQELKANGAVSIDIYNLCIEKLMFDRLVKTRDEDNALVFEQYGSKKNNWKLNVEQVITNIKNRVDSMFGVDLSVSVEIHDKEDCNLSIIDYLNYIFVQFFEKEKVDKRMFQNFKIIEPKIALIYKMDKDLFYNKNKRLNVEKY